MSQNTINAKENTDSGVCQNCHHQLTTGLKFCPSCGQKLTSDNDHKLQTILKESIFDMLHIDSKLFKTLLPLLFRPAFLSQQYIAGKRSAYFKPFKLFLSLSILYFLLISLSHHYDITYSTEFSNRSLINITNVTDSLDKPEPDDPRWVWWFYDQVGRFNALQEGTITEIITHSISKGIILLIPAFAFILRLLYIHRRRLYFDHFIFSLHYHCFVFLFLIFNELLHLASSGINQLITLLILLSYLFVALKRFYFAGLWGTIWRFFALLIIYLGVLMPIFLLSVLAWVLITT